MELEQKRALALGIIIAVVIILAVIYSLWGNVINRGTIRISGSAPFTVEVYLGDEFYCPTSPCEIDQKRGVKDLTIKKEGYETIMTEAEVELWKTVNVVANFEFVPALVEVENIPLPEPEIEYELIKDTEKQIQKLIRKDDPLGKTITYFQKEIHNPKIIGSEKSVLVLDRTSEETIAYKINVEDGSRTMIEDWEFDTIESGKWSPNGEYLVFFVRGEDMLWMLSDEVWQTTIESKIPQLTWTKDNKIIYAEKLENGYKFEIFDPSTSIKEWVNSFSDITQSPRNLVMSEDSRKLYFQSGKKNFKINLK